MIYISEYSVKNNTTRQREPVDFKISASRNFKSHYKSQSLGATQARGNKNPIGLKKYRDLWEKVSVEEDTASIKEDINKSVEEMRQHTHRLSSQIDLIKTNQDYGKSKQADLQEALEMEMFSEQQFFDNFCSRNVIQKMKSENYQNSLKLRLIMGSTRGLGVLQGAKCRTMRKVVI